MSKTPDIIRGEFHRVPLNEIIVRDAFNARNVYRDIDALARSIEANGLEQPLVCYFLPSDAEEVPVFLQSGFRRKRALDVIAKMVNTPDMLVSIMLKCFDSHEEAMLAALSVDSTGDPLRNYDYAKRCSELNKKYGTAQISKATGLDINRIQVLIRCVEDLHPSVIKVWAKAPSPELEIPLSKLNAWRKETQAEQIRLLDAYVSGDESAFVDKDGRAKRGKSGQKLDGTRRKAGARELRDILRKLTIRIENGGKPTDVARWEGAMHGIRYALGDVDKAP